MSRPKINDGLTAVKRYIKWHIAQGLCARCPNPLAKTSKCLCKRHLRMGRVSAKRLHQLHLRQRLPARLNVCGKCGAPLLRLTRERICAPCKELWCRWCHHKNHKEPNKSRCRGCLDKAAARTRKQYEARTARGVCLQCANPVRPGRRYCVIHCKGRTPVAWESLALAASIATHEKWIARYRAELAALAEVATKP